MERVQKIRQKKVGTRRLRKKAVNQPHLITVSRLTTAGSEKERREKCRLLFPSTRAQNGGEGEGGIANGPLPHVASAFPARRVSCKLDMLDQGSLQGCVAMETLKKPIWAVALGASADRRNMHISLSRRKSAEGTHTGGCE